MGPSAGWPPAWNRFERTRVLEITAAIRAKGHRIFAGALDRRTVDGSTLGFADRFLAKHFVAEGDYRDWDEIEAWADEIASDLTAAPANA